MKKCRRSCTSFLNKHRRSCTSFFLSKHFKNIHIEQPCNEDWGRHPHASSCLRQITCIVSGMSHFVQLDQLVLLMLQLVVLQHAQVVQLLVQLVVLQQAQLVQFHLHHLAQLVQLVVLQLAQLAQFHLHHLAQLVQLVVLQLAQLVQIHLHLA